MRLDGRVAAITGAGRGIGRAYALLLAELGAAVVVNDMGGSPQGVGENRAPATEVVDSIRAAGGTAVADYSDISTTEGGQSVVDTAIAEYGKIDILVNNAGNMVWGSLPEVTLETVEAHEAVHVHGTFNACRAAWPHFLDQGYGRVVLTTSVGMFGLPGNLGYAIAKAGMIGMAKSMTVGRRDADIMINCIAPNAVTRLGASAKATAAESPEPPPMMDPALVAPMVAYLAHESCDVSGQVYIAGAGRFSTLFVATTPGYLSPDPSAVTVDEVVANLAAINDQTGYDVPTSLMDWSGRFLSHLDFSRHS